MQSKIQHDLIAELKAIASDLGRVPTKQEFIERTKIGEYAYRKAFGSFIPFLHAAGLRAESKERGSILAVDLKEIITDKPSESPAKPVHGASSKILVLGDTHFPFVDCDALAGVYAWLDKNRDVTHVVQVGDLFDCFSFAKFPKSMDFTPRQELELAQKMAGQMWSTIQGIVPNAECHQLLGNHCVRPMKRVLEQCPEIEVFLDYKKFWDFPNVKTYYDVRAPLEIDGNYFTHGHFLKLGDHARKYGLNMICGHTHRGGCVSIKLTHEKTVFELNAGYLGDPHSKALSYTATKFVEWTHGFGVIDEWGARFIALDHFIK